MKKAYKNKYKKYKTTWLRQNCKFYRGKKFNNCLIIDFGTATTFDIVKNKIYEGGVIAPGVELSIKNLSQSTALLPIFDLKNK